jgi:dGTP triphosphohydrolase
MKFTTVLISRYVDAIRLLPPTKDTESVVQIESYAQDEIRMLKELTWHYVILNKELAAVQYGQREAVCTVFQTMLKAAQDDQTWNLFPPAYQEELYAAQSDLLIGCSKQRGNTTPIWVSTEPFHASLLKHTHGQGESAEEESP